MHLPNFFERASRELNKRDDSERYYLYFGRLSEEKGVLTLVKAAGRDIPLYIVGTGPVEPEIKKYINENKLSNVKMLGFKRGQELYDLVGNAKVVVLPSEWYENGPYSAIEALSMSRPIIGADIGGIPELINNNGLLFRSGDAEDLRKKILEFESMDADKYNNMKRASYELYEREYTPRVYYDKLIKIYEKVKK